MGVYGRNPGGCAQHAQVSARPVLLPPVDGAGAAVEASPYLVFRLSSLPRDNWMEVPGLKTAWDALSTAFAQGKADEARDATLRFRHACLSGGDPP